MLIKQKLCLSSRYLSQLNKVLVTGFIALIIEARFAACYKEPGGWNKKMYAAWFFPLLARLAHRRMRSIIFYDVLTNAFLIHDAFSIHKNPNFIDWIV